MSLCKLVLLDARIFMFFWRSLQVTVLRVHKGSLDVASRNGAAVVNDVVFAPLLELLLF